MMMKPSYKIPDNARDAILLFNQKDFFASHELFENAWRETVDDSREFFRALLQISAGHFRLTQNRPTAAKKFFDKAQYWLKPFSEDHLGFELNNLRNYLNQLINAIDQATPPECILEDGFQPLHSTFINNEED